jgi:hypothetical protein
MVDWKRANRTLRKREDLGHQTEFVSGASLRQTFAHLLNECPPNYELMTERHTQVVRVVKEAVLNFVDENLRSDIHENTTFG